MQFHSRFLAESFAVTDTKYGHVQCDSARMFMFMFMSVKSIAHKYFRGRRN
jgi:hypothetical protein